MYQLPSNLQHVSCIIHTSIKIVLLSQDPAIARGWVAEINSAIRSVSAGRPARVLALVNPKGGARKAAKVWAKKAQPILHLAGLPTIPSFCKHTWMGLRIRTRITNLNLNPKT